MRHDRGLEEPPEHPDDCGCTDCATGRLIEEMPDATELELAIANHPDDCEGCDVCRALDNRALRIMRHGLFDPHPVSDTHLCSGGPEEITDEEWESWRAERSARIERMAEAGVMPGPEDDDG